MAGVFGRYALLKSLGHGDMADVWKASLRGPADFKKVFALKILLQELSAGRDFVDVFVEEARVLGSLAHPNIVQVTDFGEEAGRYFVATEFVHGKDLDAVQKRFAARGLRMPMEMAMLIGVDLARALGAAHVRTAPDGAPVIHREVFPKNVLVSYHGEVKLADFRSPRVRSVAPAKLVYRSPEQTRSETLDRRSDLFSLGLLVLDLITGAKPTEGMPRDPATFAFPEKETAALTERAREILRKAVSLDRNQRFADAGEMEAAFTEVLGGKGILEARRSLRSTLEKLFTEEMKAEAAEDPAAPLPPAPAEAPPPIARDTVSVPVTPRKPPPKTGDRPSGADSRVSGSGAAVAAPAPDRMSGSGKATPSGSGRAPVQPAATANTEPGIDMGVGATGSGTGAGVVANAPHEPSTVPGIRGPAVASVSPFDDEPGTVDGDPPLLRGSTDGLEAFSDKTDSVRKPNATRVAAPQPSGVADLGGPARPEPSRSFREDLFPKEKIAKNKNVLLAIGAGGGALVAAVLGFLLVSFLFGGGPAPATPTPTPIAATSPEQTEEATPAPTATPAKTPKPTATRVVVATPRPTPTPKPATPRPTPTPAPTKVAMVTPKVVTPTPTPAPVGPMGELTIRSKMPLDVYVDGKKVKLNAPIKVAAGTRKVRFVEEEEEIDLPKDVDVPANGRVDVLFDAGKIIVTKR